ncbi:MAG: hypothetical protein JKY54_07595 [Flavobacteriales bacterium]|nr:hypothetical protein [Flavobacteriales bacterium]
MKSLLLIFAGFSLFAWNSPEHEICTIQGQVANEVAGIGRAKVVLLVDGHVSVEATTSYNGKFTLQFVPDDQELKFELKCSAPLHQTKTITLKRSDKKEWLVEEILLNPEKNNRIPGRTIKWDIEAWDRRSVVR